MYIDAEVSTGSIIVTTCLRGTQKGLPWDRSFFITSDTRDHRIADEFSTFDFLTRFGGYRNEN